MSEEFIRREYGAFTRGISLNDAKEQQRKARNTMRNRKKNPPLSEQRDSMQARRDAYQKIINAGIINTVREGKTMITGKTSDVKERILDRMNTMTSRQLDVLGDVVADKRVVNRFGASSWYERQKAKIAKRTNTQAMLLNANQDDLLKQILGNPEKDGFLDKAIDIGRSLNDDKGFDVDVDPFKGDIMFQYKIDF